MVKEKLIGLGAIFSLIISTSFMHATPVRAQLGNETSESLNLNEIVVTATKTKHLLKDVPVETEVITKKEIEESNALTVADILRYVPGIFVRGENVPGITNWRASIRGLTFNDGYGLILIDGQRVMGGGMGEYGFGLNQIPPQMIERIEVVKGPNSVLYGSDAIAGVVNIITKPAPDKTIYGFETDYGSHYTNVEYLYWGTKKNKLGMLFQAGREESKMGAYGVKSTRDEHFKRTTLISKFAYPLSKSLEFDLKLSAQEENRERTDFQKGYTRISRDLKYRIAPKLKINLSSKGKIFISSYWYAWNFKTHEYNGSSGYTPRNGNMYYTDVETRYVRPLLNSHLITLGAEYLQQKLDYNLAHKTLNLTSVYAQDEMKIHLGVPAQVVLGARLDHHSKYGTELCPKVSTMMLITKSTKVRASVGRGFKSPTIRQAYYDEPFQHSSYWYKSNPNLKAETSWGYSLGIEQILSSRILGSITFFRNDITNMIVKVETNETISGLPVYTYENVEKAYTQGVETNIKCVLVKNYVLLHLGYTYTDTKNKSTGKELPYVPHHDLVGNLIFNYEPWDVFFSIGGQYVSKMYKDIQNTKKTRDYSIIDVKFAKRFKKHYSISIEGNNIFNSNYGDPDKEWWGAIWLVKFKMDF
ncbi:MAG: TonB-dependent receptor [Thermodesulfobacteria bacterium]|nr:TonB-dependent receptor [Thermodesulfobacteriota bacterium]